MWLKQKLVQFDSYFANKRRKSALDPNSSDSNKAYLGSYWNDHRKMGGIEERAVRYLLADVVLGHGHHVDLDWISSDRYVEAEVDSIFNLELEPYVALMRKQLEATEKGLGPYKLMENAEGELVFRSIPASSLQIEYKRDSITPKEASDHVGANMQDRFRYFPFYAYMEWMVERGTLSDVLYASKVFLALHQVKEVQENFNLFGMLHHVLSYTMQNPRVLLARQRDDASRS